MKCGLRKEDAAKVRDEMAEAKKDGKKESKDEKNHKECSISIVFHGFPRESNMHQLLFNVCFWLF